MNTYIKPVIITTAVILTLAGTFIAGVESRPFITEHFASKDAPKAQETAKANYAPKEYGMNELVENARNTQFVDIPQKPITGEN